MFDGIDIRSGIEAKGRDAIQAVAESGAGTIGSPLPLCGALDGDGARRLRDVFLMLGDTAEQDVVLDFTDVGFLDGAGIGAIAFLFRRLAARRRRLSIVGAHGQPLLTLQDLGLARLLAERRHGPADTSRRLVPRFTEARPWPWLE